MKLLLLLLLLNTFAFGQWDSPNKSDYLIIGNPNSEKSIKNTKIKTYEKIPFTNQYRVYGKYNGINYETGEINFIGNNGNEFSDPSMVLSIHNNKGQEYVAPQILNTLRNKLNDLAKKQLKEQCEKNQSINITVLPFKNDYYGLSDDVRKIFTNEACYNSINYLSGVSSSCFYCFFFV